MIAKSLTIAQPARALGFDHMTPNRASRPRASVLNLREMPSSRLVDSHPYSAQQILASDVETVGCPLRGRQVLIRNDNTTFWLQAFSRIRVKLESVDRFLACRLVSRLFDGTISFRGRC
jgi:hypothetical protein